jgi:hypothetical protein
MSVNHSRFGAAAVIAPHLILLSRWARPACLAAATLAEHAPPAVPTADPPHPPVTPCMAGVSGFVGQQPVAVLRIIVVRVEQRVGEVGLVQLPSSDRGGEPAVVGLAGELEDPARHRDGDPVAGGRPKVSS